MFSVAIAVSVFTAACGGKVSQCNRISTVVNKAANEAKAASKSNNPDRVGELEKAAITIDQYSQELAPVQVKDKTLQGLQSRFIRMYQATS